MMFALTWPSVSARAIVLPLWIRPPGAGKPVLLFPGILWRGFGRRRTGFDYQDPVAFFWRRKLAGIGGDDRDGGAGFAIARIEPTDVWRWRQGVELDLDGAVFGHVHDHQILFIGTRRGNVFCRAVVTGVVDDEHGGWAQTPEIVR